MGNLSPANEARLRAAIMEYGLQAVEKEIVAVAMETATFYTTERDKYAQVGNSRSGGVPDLPDKSWWPKTADGKFYRFYMQINLADVPDFIGNVLPRRGMLYCFMADFEDAAVVWADVEPSMLKRMRAKPVKQLSNWDDQKILPYKLAFCVDVNVPQWCHSAFINIKRKIDEIGNDPEDDPSEDQYIALECLIKLYCEGRYMRAGKLLGYEECSGYGSDLKDEKADNETDLKSAAPPVMGLLWLLGEDVNVTYGDTGNVQVFIHSNALAAHDFSHVAMIFDTA